jgi:lysophospholipase L1-like esterase
MASRARTLVFTLVATLLPLALMAIGWEFVLRWLEPPLPGNTGSIIRPSPDAEKQFELIPGATGSVAGARTTVNSFGCRDREYQIPKPRGVVRIVGIGDSLTFGQGVEEEDTFLARLERDLTARGLRVEVINCGVFGYNVNEEARRFQEVAELLEPDIVLIGYELGDPLPNPPLKKEATSASEGSQAPRSLVQGRALVDLVKESRVISFLAYRYSFLLKKFSFRNWDSLYADGSPLWKNLSDKYAGMAATARARKIDVAVAIVPQLSNLDEGYPFKSIHNRVAVMCRTQGMKVVDLLPAFLGQDGPRLWIHPRDRHPNAEGHRFIADALLEPVAAMVKERVPPPVASGSGPRKK